jgi:hypothetical protein
MLTNGLKQESGLTKLKIDVAMFTFREQQRREKVKKKIGGKVKALGQLWELCRIGLLSLFVG